MLIQDTNTIGYGYCEARKSKNRVQVSLETVVIFIFKRVVHKFSWLVVEIQYHGTSVWYNKDIKKWWYYFQPTVLSTLKWWVECKKSVLLYIFLTILSLHGIQKVPKS